MKKYPAVLLYFMIIVLSACTGLRAEKEHATAVVRVRLSKDLTIKGLVEQNVDILAVYRDGKVDLAVTPIQLDWVSARAPMAEILERSMQKAPTPLDANLGLYHTYDELQTALDSLHTLYPDLTVLDTLGTSIEGRLIRAIKISDNPLIDEDEPEVLLLGCHHAREIMSVEIPLMMVSYLLDNYGTSPQATHLVDNREIWIVPMINPDGHVYVQNNHETEWWNWWRKNRRDNGDGTFGVDLNRNYGYEWGYDDVGSDPNPGGWTYRGSTAFSEPETQAVRDFCNSREFVTALSFHTYGELIIYPWGYDAIFTDNHVFFAVLADSLMRGNGYTPGCTATNVLYPANGSSDDWTYGDTTLKPPIYSYTVEMNNYVEGGFGPPDTMIQPTFDKVLQMILTIIERAGNPFGVMPPQVPEMYEVADLADPSHLISWSAGSPSDPNSPVSYRLEEYKGLSGVSDPVEIGDTLWTEEGFSLSSNRVYSGSASYYSGNDNYLFNYLEMATFYPSSFGNTLSCQMWYAIESGWDYAFLQASLDDGFTWQTVPGNLTTTDDPYGNNIGNGITGYSGGWVLSYFYLDQIAGYGPDTVLKLRFVYSTDASVTEEGIYIDNISPVTAYEAKTVLSETWPDTMYIRDAEETGTFAYQVSAIDAEGHVSMGSNVVFHTVNDITGDEAVPVFRSALAQNFPNPFNPSTTINFTVGGREDSDALSHVRMAVFDIAGRKVVSLADRGFTPGEHSVRWEGINERGIAVASGVYFLRLEIDSSVFQRKIVMLR